MRNVAANVTRFQTHVPSGANIQERLASVGAAILQWALASDTVELMRLGIAEARHFPDLASRVHTMATERGIEAVAKLLNDVAAEGELGAAPAFAAERLPITTRFFLDLVILPLLMRALSGEKAKTLQQEIRPHVARTVSFFLAACRVVVH
ncbi:TetR/AcrR family transcriptional regulator C-terminal domain-containing protein [Bradyrhizobium sp. RDM4]